MRTGFLAAIALSLSLSFTVRAQFTNSFQTNTISAVTSNWVGNGTYVVGSNTFFDTLIIQSGGVLSNGTGYLGYESNASNNIAIVRDAGSSWSNRFDLNVGFHGAGNRLVISNGATVVDSNATIGTVNFLSNSNNSVLVTGPGSVWTNRGSLDIGRLCSGNQLMISNGGKVFDVAAGVGDHSGASTNGAVLGNRIVVTGTNSAWINTLNISEVPFDDNAGGQLLTVANGAAFFSGAGVGIADSAASDHIIILVTDPGTTWTNLAQLAVGGFGGYNQFVVSNGATAYTGLSVIGGLSTSNAVIVTGPGSVWTVGGGITVADSGVASFLTVTNGGLVRAQNQFVGIQAGSSGSLIVAGGTNEVFNSLQLGQFGGAGTVNITSGALFVTNASATATAVVNANCTLILGNGLFKSDNLVVTNGGVVQYALTYQVDNGTVTVSGGSLQAGSNLFIAASADSTSTVVVANGTLVATNGAVTVGNNGTITGGGGAGRLTVSTNGTLLASTILLGSGTGGQSDLVQDGGTVRCVGTNCLIVINTKGWSIIGDLVWSNANSILQCAVTAPGDFSPASGATYLQELYIGYSDVGTMTMSGANVDITTKFIIGDIGPPFSPSISTGAVWITGGLLTVTNPASYCIIGNNGAGQMTLSNGTVTMATVVVGNNNNGNPGMLTVVGAGSVMTILSNLTVGNCGFGNVGAVTVAGGNLFVTNATHTAVLDVQDGTFTMSGGFLQVDKLIVTNSCGHFTHTGGTLLYGQLVLDPNLSAVGDGIPNGWKQHYGLDPFDPAVANADSDGDGLSNLQEYQRGFNPTDSAAYLHIVGIAKTGNDIKVTYLGANGDLTWSPGIAAGTNVLEFTVGRVGGNYSNNFVSTGQTNVLAGGIGLGVITNMVHTGGATNKPAVYYRVRLVP